MKIIHIHSDPKFVTASIKRFQSKKINNRFIFLGDREQLINLNNEGVIFFRKEKEVIPQIIDYCRDYDMVILYYLNGIKIDIALQMPKGIIMVWRFFGSELYSLIPHRIYSATTQRYIRLGSRTQRIKKQIKSRLIKTYPRALPIIRAVERIDYFIGVYQEEYEYLKDIGFDLPDFILKNINKETFFRDSLNFYKQPYVIVGNSRNKANNHLDILKGLDKISNNTLSVKMFFSYGPEDKYTQAIRHFVQNRDWIMLIEEFLEKDGFQNIYGNAAALVINSYRQMALGNIFTAIGTGTKIYLSKKNSTYAFFLNNDIRVFSIEDCFFEDYKNNEVFLSKEEAIHNVEKMKEISKKYTVEDFQRKIIKIIESNYRL